MPDLSNWGRAYILYYFDEKATRFFTGLAKVIIIIIINRCIAP